MSDRLKTAIEAAAKRLRLGVEGPACADELEAAFSSFSVAGVVEITDAMVERATMTLLGHAEDTSPGIDWHCNRQWTVNTVRERMRLALGDGIAAYVQEHAERGWQPK